jgi:hypothetical protein
MSELATATSEYVRVDYDPDGLRVTVAVPLDTSK